MFSEYLNFISQMFCGRELLTAKAGSRKTILKSNVSESIRIIWMFCEYALAKLVYLSVCVCVCV